jgi:hypothetical protein
MRFRIERKNGEMFAIPMCRNADLACKFAKAKYLDCEQVKILQMFGLPIAEQDLHKEDVQYFYVKGDRHE